MNNQDENLDLLDLDDNGEVDTLPEAAPFSVPRPKKPWLLMGLGVAIIVLATWIIIVRVGGDSGTTINVDLDAPVVSADVLPKPDDNLKVPPKPVEVAPKPQPVQAQKVQPTPEPKPVAEKKVEEVGTPIRVIEDRKDVTFNPDKVDTKPVAKPQPKPAKKINPPVQKNPAVASGSIYVQFGSYSTRELAQAAEQKIRSAHKDLFEGKQFVILAAQVNGKTTYRLRIAFNSGADANGFCRNAKSDGLDCYVTK